MALGIYSYLQLFWFVQLKIDTKTNSSIKNGLSGYPYIVNGEILISINGIFPFLLAI